jgi:two-component sensor histidine kinase
MRKGLSFLTLLLFLVTIAFGQDVSKQDADSMLLALKKSKTGMERFDLLLSVAQYHIFKPGEQQVDFDSAILFINEASALNKTLKSPAASGYQLLTESYLMKERGKKDESRKMVENATRMLESGNNKTYLGRAYYELSTYYTYNDSLELSKRIVLVKQSIDAFQQASNLKAKATSLEMLGDLYNIQSDYARAMPALTEAVAIYDNIGYRKMQGIYILLGKCNLSQGIYGQALFYFLKSLKTAQMLHDSTMQLCQINNYLGLLYKEIDRKDLAVKYWKDAMETAKKHGDEYSISAMANNMAAAYNDLDRPEEALKILASIPKTHSGTEYYLRAYIYLGHLRSYTALKQFSKAKPYCDWLTKLAANDTDPGLGMHNTHRIIASYYFSIGQYQKAQYYLTKNLSIEQKIPFSESVIRGYKLWSRLDSAQGNFRSAFKHLLLYQAKTDSILSENKLRQLQVLGVEYEVGMKEDSIKLKDKDIALLTQKNSLQQANLEKQSLIKNITTAGIIVAFIIIALLYRQYMQKQKNNKAITQKNEQLQHYLAEKDWLVKEIHHRVKNNLQTVMSLLGTQAGYLKNEEAITAMADSRHRIQSMSLIHQRLYQSGNLSSIKMTDYIYELVDFLGESYNSNNRIRFNLEIEPIELDLAHCIPLGLILNEAITNSFKYAFPGDREGIIRIVLKTSSENNFLLTIKDNGTGLPDGFDVSKSHSMGMNLMQGLSAELGAKFIIYNDHGTFIAISFIYERPPSNDITQTITETASLV